MTISISSLLKLLQRQPIRQRNNTMAEMSVVGESPWHTVVSIHIKQPKHVCKVGQLHRQSKQYSSRRKSFPAVKKAENSSLTSLTLQIKGFS